MHTLRKQNTFQQENVNFLLKFFVDTNPSTSMAPPQVHEILKDINRRHVCSKQSPLKMNQVQGALIYPEFNLLVQSDATNNHFTCDCLALAESPCDDTPAVMHAVISAVNAEACKKYFESKGISTQRIGKQAERILLTVKSPEDETKELDLNIDLFLVDQVRKVKDISKMKGQTYFDPSYLAGSLNFGQQDIE